MTVGAEGWPVLKHSPIRAGLSVCLRPGGAAGDGAWDCRQLCSGEGLTGLSVSLYHLLKMKKQQTCITHGSVGRVSCQGLSGS